MNYLITIGNDFALPFKSRCRSAIEYNYKIRAAHELSISCTGQYRYRYEIIRAELEHMEFGIVFTVSSAMICNIDNSLIEIV
jgi:hypothetical protein